MVHMRLLLRDLLLFSLCRHTHTTGISAIIAYYEAIIDFNFAHFLRGYQGLNNLDLTVDVVMSKIVRQSTVNKQQIRTWEVRGVSSKTIGL